MVDPWMFQTCGNTFEIHLLSTILSQGSGIMYEGLGTTRIRLHVIFYAQTLSTYPYSFNSALKLRQKTKKLSSWNALGNLQFVNWLERENIKIYIKWEARHPFYNSQKVEPNFLKKCSIAPSQTLLFSCSCGNIFNSVL